MNQLRKCGGCLEWQETTETMKLNVLPMIISSCKVLALFLVIACILITSTFQFSAATDTISPRQNLTNGETIISSGGVFELGLFTPGNSSRNWYLGIWYRNVASRIYVWVANRDAPMTSSMGVVLRVSEPGVLVLLNSSNGVVWSTNSSRTVQNPVAQLLDTGNLVVRDSSDGTLENSLWQSFDYPTDTYLPGMKLGWNLATGLETYIVSWRSEDDPGRGEYNWHLDLNGFPQALIKRGSEVVYRCGPWNGIRASGCPLSPSHREDFVMNEKEVYYTEVTIDGSVAPWNADRLRFGKLQKLTWVGTRGWATYKNSAFDICDAYGRCGVYGQCDVRMSPSCGCLDRFVPRNRDGWARANWSSGCLRRTNLSCEGDGFLRYVNVKLPDTRNSWYNASLSLDECRTECLRNCSCMAYAQLDIRRRAGCLIWYGDLIDIKITSLYGQDIFIRVASSETVELKGRNERILIASLTSVIGLFLICISVSVYLRMGKKKDKTIKEELYGENKDEDSELPSFDLSIILKATNDFSPHNKLGEGGFGPVHKGILEGGEEIAVKRLSKDSFQGLDELKNEIWLIAKLQHRNLVRLLGCCIKGEDRMLIYEYVPNKSLDGILFDKMKSKLLDWPTRFKIINGIARGLMYLHHDSRLRIIHRDLKAGNILLDNDMTPKISDFGLARRFGRTELVANTKRVIGTYGYMSPEYVLDGMFSIKSDVYSFGILVLEIVTGMRSTRFLHSEHGHNLPGHAWILHKEGRFLELIDPNLGDSCSLSEMIKSIHIGLLCVQKHPGDRPKMSSVVTMLENEVVFPPAKEPGFFWERTFTSHQTLGPKNPESGPNEITISLLEAR